MTEPLEFDLKLAIDCARSFSDATGLGCTISDTSGRMLYEAGYGCESCEACALAGKPHEGCIRTHIYGMTEAERFGGKYIYFCQMGFSCFVSPIVGPAGSAAKITVGPFLMVDREDYVAYDLELNLRLEGEAITAVSKLLHKIPYIPPSQVQSMSNLLFMAVGFQNNVSAANRMLERQGTDMIQGQINAYILELKRHEEPMPYPLETERAMVEAISHSDRPKAQAHLNELLGFVLFSSGGDMALIRTRIYELLVVISRAAVDAGASPDWSLGLNHEFMHRSGQIEDVDTLYFLLSDVLNRYMDNIFRFVDVRHMDVIHKAVDYVGRHYDKKITLEDVAATVYLSPSYFSKIFKQEMGASFNSYLNRVRIDKSKKLLAQNLKLVEVSTMVGFEDQSYFTKVFKRVTGVSPNRYREQGGRK